MTKKLGKFIFQSALLAVMGVFMVTAANAAQTVDNNDLANRVRSELRKYPQVDVATHNGVVTLSGTVATDNEKDDAVKMTRNVAGVTSVTDNIRIMERKSESVGEYIDDAAITTAIKGKFLGQGGLDSMDISVETNNGIVTLTGQVDTDAQVALAERVAKETDGVKKVENRLTRKNR